jgi:predicted NUDIX family NTP pyrophosphohydrolase
MAAISAGILMYHHGKGGRSFSSCIRADRFGATVTSAWSIPKGELDDGEDLEAAARREFKEELGIEANGPLRPLGDIRQRSGKIVHAFALEGDLDVSAVRSNTIAIRWPPRSGRTIHVPEIDSAAWFDLPLARKKMLAGQRPLLERLERLANARSRERER